MPENKKGFVRVIEEKKAQNLVMDDLSILTLDLFI